MGSSDSAPVVNDDSRAQITEVNVFVDNPNWFSQTVSGYLKGETSVDRAAALIAEPIDEAFSTGNHWVLLWQSEKTTVHQRGFYGKDQGEELWGQPEDVPQPPQSSLDMPTAEGQLWNLWASILHPARRTPWSDHAKHEKLISLVKALKAKPNPPMPERITVATRKNWVWKEGAVWSVALLLGPTARELWNDCPGVGIGFTLPEQHGWANINSFVARLTATNIADFSMYMMWAMRDAFEESYDVSTSTMHHKAQKVTRLGANAMAAAVWVLVAGKALYEQRNRDDEGRSSEEPEPELWGEGQELPWSGSEVVNGLRWSLWRRGFQECSKNERLTEEVRAMCGEAAAKIVSYEQAATRSS